MSEQTDAVAQAREALSQTLRSYVRIERGDEGGHPKTDRDIQHDDAANEQEIDALIAAVTAQVRAECAAKVTDVLARLSAMPMRSPSPEQMAVLLFANNAMAEVSRTLAPEAQP